MRFFFRLLGVIIFTLPFVLVIAAYLSLQEQALVKQATTLTHSDINRAKKIIKENDPRQLKEGQKKSMTLSEQDVSIALNYLFSQLVHVKAGIETRFSDQTIGINGTVMLPVNRGEKYLNFKLSLVQQQDKLAIDQFSIAKVQIPGALIQELFSLYTKSGYGKQFSAVTDMLHSAHIIQHQLKLSYIWNPGLVNQVKDLLITEQDREALIAYQQQLDKITRSRSKSRKYSLTVILEPMFRYASERSVSHNPVEENRALITVLAAYIKGSSLRHLTGTTQKKPQQLKLSLHQRHDFVQHFIISAGLAVVGGSALADAIGLYKEYEDQKGSSGFSFTDLAADRAGVRLGVLATASNASARHIQALMSRQLTESVFMPKTNDLPEGIHSKVFQRRYQGGKGAEYQRMVNLIERRVDALAVNQ